MTAAHITRRQSHRPARGIVGFLLLHRIEDTDKHGGVFLAIVCGLIVLGAALGLLP